jgi:hypothetical protein
MGFGDDSSSCGQAAGDVVLKRIARTMNNASADTRCKLVVNIALPSLALTSLDGA